MKQELFSIYDKKAETFSMPFPAINKGAAIRQLNMEVNSERESLLKKFPEDYSLYLVEEFNTESGLFKGYEKPLFVIEIKDVVSQ